MVASFSQEALGDFAEIPKVYQANLSDPLVRRAASMSHALNRVFVSASLLIEFLDPDDYLGSPIKRFLWPRSYC